VNKIKLRKKTPYSLVGFITVTFYGINWKINYILLRQAQP